MNQPEDEIPKRFINGCDGDLKEARRRWEITRDWREKEGVDTVVEEPQPHFDIIKEHYPFYWCGRGKKEGHLVFYERPGELDRKVDPVPAVPPPPTSRYASTPPHLALKRTTLFIMSPPPLPPPHVLFSSILQVLIEQTGLTVVEMLRHWLYVTEYQWKYLAPDEMAKTISVVDMGAVTMSSLTGEPFKFLNASIKCANAHYPERSYVIYIVNAPGWFSFLWKMIKG